MPRLNPNVRRWAAEVPQIRPVRALTQRLTRKKLRILAFHGIADASKFSVLVDAILDHYTPVTAAQVGRGLKGLSSLPDKPVWFTFDDGEPSVFEAGHMLAQRGIEATAFVCPAVIGTANLLWFQTMARCLERGLVTADERERFTFARFKLLIDDVRRSETQVLERRLAADGFVPPAQVDIEGLERWLRLGHEIGNHTWDHPCLDHCPPDEQAAQVRRAHEWLTERGFPVRFFAYPNGNWTATSAAVAQGLGYEASLLFDHRLASVAGPTDRVSRLRINADAPVRRGLSILSGAHSAMFHLRPQTRPSAL